jgi:two-component system, NtrC family, sensor kinase
VAKGQVMRFHNTLTFRVLFGSCLLLFALFAVYSYFSISRYNKDMRAQLEDSASRISDIIKKSARYSMLQDRTDDVHQIINTIGQEPGVAGIRIYNKRGEITFSTNRQEQGMAVDLKAEACVVCHQSGSLQFVPSGDRTRLVWPQGQGHILALINPIRNEEACSNADCHAHPPERTILGVLDVRLSLEKMDAKIASAKSTLILYAVAGTLVIALVSGFFLFFTVHRPVQGLVEGTRQISSGNLDYRIVLNAKNEIGGLARAFNEMTASLRKAEQENRSWSETLEQRIQEKTNELRQIHERIMQIEKMASLGKLSATVAHELNNPLEGILTYSKLIARRLGRMESPAEPVHQSLEDLELIIHEVQRCGNIVKNLLLFSRKQVGEFSVAPLQGIVDKAVLLMQHHFKISNVEFCGNYSSDATLMCDENQIQQALVALFVNAVEAMPSGGVLSLNVNRSATGDVELEIGDSGIGIAAEDLPHVFEPFFTTKKEGKGVGLGLSVVYGIVERHGGTVTVKSESGKGTTFTLSFPPPSVSSPRMAKEALLRTPSREDGKTV